MNLWHTFRTTAASTLMALALFGTNIGNATAGWVAITDPNTADGAANPGYPSDQSAESVGAYLQDLLDLANPPQLVASVENYAGAPLTGLGNPAPGMMFVLAFHFGNGNDYWPHTEGFDVFFTCASQCDSFTLPSTKAVSNYRLYDPPNGTTESCCSNNVPEPGSLALFAGGVAAMLANRRRLLGVAVRRS